MADIKITASNQSGLFSLELDQWEWTSLTINGAAVPKRSGNVQFQWTQVAAGPVHFVATSNNNIVIQNAGNLLYMQSKDKTKTFLAQISYAATAQQVTLTGVLVNLAFPIPGAQPSPIKFSQGRMTGTFSLAT